MRYRLLAACCSIALPWAAAVGGADQETPYGKGLTEANQERCLLDDMDDVADWYNGSPDETTLSRSINRVKEGRGSLVFANVVDHTRGEKNYPVGWPRTGKDLGREKLTDWSGYDFFQCWIYTETSRDALPSRALGINLYHSGPKRSTSLPLEVRKDQWVKIVIPVAKLDEPADVQRLQFSISESEYKHGDRVAFTIDSPALVRYVEPAVAELSLERRLLTTSDTVVVARYKLVGHKGLDGTIAELSIAPATADSGPAAATASGKASRDGELPVVLPKSLTPGAYEARLSLRDAQGKLIDRRQAEFRVIAGPF